MKRSSLRLTKVFSTPSIPLTMGPYKSWNVNDGWVGHGSIKILKSAENFGDFLYIFGGWNGKKALNDLYVLDLDKLK